MKNTLMAGVGAVALGFAAPAMATPAGNILLTGHDNDYHCTFGDSNACAALGVESSYVRNGSTLPVLVIDDGSELSGSLSGLGIPIVSMSVGSVTAGMFNNSTYSAFAVASVTTCGGCDNPVGTGTALAAFSTAIAAFHNAGGGILGLTAANDPAGFAYVPEAAAGLPIFSSSGFVATPAGIAGVPGFFAVNGDETHNIFTTFSSAYTVAEVDSFDSNAAVTLFTNAPITCTGTKCHIHGVPEPMSLTLLGAGLFGLGIARRRWSN